MPRRGAKPASARADDRRRRPADVPSRPDEAPSLELAEIVARLAAERDHLREELARARHRIASLERLADEDALTPVANRRAFVRQLTRVIAYTHRYGVPASLVYFDVNNMKRINDEHGHDAGDAALRHIATVLRANTRSSDVVGRLGGDEFGVILAQTDAEQAHRKAAVLAQAIAAEPLHWHEVAIAVTAAYGVHAFSGADNPRTAIEAADRAMYERKRAAAHAGAEPD